MSEYHEYHTKVFYSRIAYIYNGKPAAGCCQPGWYYEVKERKGNITFNSTRGAYDTADEASRAMSKDIRSREVAKHIDQLTLEAKEMMLGLSPKGVRYGKPTV